MSDLNVVHAALGGAGPVTTASPARGPTQGELDLIGDGAIAIRDGVVSQPSGETAEVLPGAGATRRSPRSTPPGWTVLPGFIECHSHPCSRASRHAEYAKRLAGASLAEIAARRRRNLGQRGRDARSRRASSSLAQLRYRPTGASCAAAWTTLEVKSGYGLTAETERPTS